MDTKIAIETLDLYYSEFHALKNINMRIPEKEITAFKVLLAVANQHC